MYHRFLNLSVSVIFLISLFLIKSVPLKVNAAPNGNYLIFNGGQVKAENNNQSVPQAFSFEAWIKPSSTTNKRDILTVEDSSNGQKHYQIGINGGTFELAFYYNNSSLRVINTGQIQTNQWQHVGVTISDVAVNLFINGQNIHSSSGVTNLKSIGKDIVLGSNYNGEMDMLRISNSQRNISQNWQNNVYNSLLAADGATVLLWNFDQIRGETTATDSSQNQITGYLTGGDYKIHYFGEVPTPTKFFQFILPTLPELKKISWPTGFNNPYPTQSENPQPTGPHHFFSTTNRPILTR